MTSTPCIGAVELGTKCGADPDNLLANSSILIRLLGKFHVLKMGNPVRISSGSKAEKLLCWLALEQDHGVLREVLLNAIWPQSEPRLAGANLNSLVYTLNKLLGDGTKRVAPIVCADGICRLNAQANIGVDIKIFERLVNAGQRYVQTGNPQFAFALYQRACDLYRGDLHAGTDVHAVIERERLRAIYLTVLAYLADCCYVDANYAACHDYSLRLLASDPCREDAHRLVMRCYVRLGERAQALHQYRLCEQILHAEFDAAPEASTQALFNLIRLDPDRI